MDKREDTGNYYPGGTVVTGVPVPAPGGGSSVEVVPPSVDGAGKAADAAAVYDTLQEIAEYIQQDKTGAAQMVANIEANAKAIGAEVKRATDAETALGKAICKKVDEEEGKGLSTEDYTTEEKNKLIDIEDGAQKNVPPVAPDENAGEGVPADAALVFQALLDFKEDVLRACVAKYPFEFHDPITEDGAKLFCASPFKSLSYTAGDEEGEQVGVRMEEIEGLEGVVRDCALVIDTRGKSFAPNVTWPANFHPRTDAETDFACDAGVRNVYWITEYAPNEFVVAGWQETDGGGTSEGGAA